jgi:type VI secretion system protein ImpH
VPALSVTFVATSYRTSTAEQWAFLASAREADTDVSALMESFAWTFGDGDSAEATSADVVHRYNRCGRYRVTLTVRLRDGRTATCGGDLRVSFPSQLRVYMFGLLGPNGPLPLHVTEYIRERLHHAGDPTPARFLDLFHHRFLALFYRAWAQAQPHVNHDRPDADRFANCIASFIGLGAPALRNRDTVPDVAKLFHATALMVQPRSRDGLAAIIRQFFGVAVRIEEFVGGWMPLGERERTRLGERGAGASLGGGAVLGGRVWDRQHRFRIHLGPLGLADYRRFLPGDTPLRELVDWVRFYLGFELEWDVRLQLAATQVPRLELGRQGQLGWTTWLGKRRTSEDAGDLRLNAERFVARDRRAVA